MKERISYKGSGVDTELGVEDDFGSIVLAVLSPEIGGKIWQEI